MTTVDNRLRVRLTPGQQAELAVSRLAKDAEARCAEWLLRRRWGLR